jgi:hypothetical protein
MIEIIHPNGLVLSPENQDQPTREQLCKWIDCEWIEIVRVYYQGKYEQLIVDEEGRLIGKLLNPVATDIYLENTKVHNKEMYEHAKTNLNCYILGTAVLLTGESKLE